MFQRFLAFFLFAIFMVACNQSSSEQSQSNDVKGNSSDLAKAETEQLPPMPLDTLKMLYDNTDYVDFVFFDANFSISQNDKASIQATVAHISTDGTQINPSCQPRGRVFYQMEGINRFEADFFLNQECVYFIFYQQGKKMYATKMTQQGFNFFANIYQQANQQQQQQQQ
ncbi:MAG: hypothetical protein MRY78_00310 [Saprospiraceae bacterium]|nr:hypothetical protein [Saprospiraceae bacterium]